MVRNHRFFNKKFNRPGTQARTRPGAPPMAQMWPEQRWSRKWSEIIDSLIRNLLEPGHGRDHSQETRPGGRQAAAAAAASLLKLIREQKKRCANRTRLPKADTPHLREGCTRRNHDCRISKDIRQSTRTECDRVAQSQMAISKIDSTSESGHARTTGRCDKSKRHMCKARRRDANRTNTERKLPQSSAGRSGLRPTKQRRVGSTVSPKCGSVGSR